MVLQKLPRLSSGDSFVNTTNISTTVSLKMLLKPQNENGFQENHCPFRVLKDGFRVFKLSLNETNFDVKDLCPSPVSLRSLRHDQPLCTPLTLFVSLRLCQCRHCSLHHRSVTVEVAIVVMGVMRTYCCCCIWYASISI